MSKLFVVLFTFICFAAIYYQGDSMKKRDTINELLSENIHLKNELKKANSDTTHKHCIKNYKP